MYSALLKPCRIGGMEVKNRVIMAPMPVALEAAGSLRAAARDFYIARAKGGVGLIVLGALMLDGQRMLPQEQGLLLPAYAAAVAMLAVDVHSYGARLCLELSSDCAARSETNTPPSPSSLPVLPPPRPAHELSRTEIASWIRSTARAAAAARQNGADAVMLHAAGGWQLDQFQSAAWNLRDDEYGGDIGNRLRLTSQLIAAVKAAAGYDFPVLVKFSVCHGTPSGRLLAEGLDMCRLLEQAGADALLVDTGSYAARWNRSIPTVYEPDGFALPAAAAVKQAVSIPVIAQGKLADPNQAVLALDENQCDLIALGHALLADPQWVNKAAQELSAEIRPCVGCNECLRAVCAGGDYVCAVNPLLWHETDPAYARTPVRQPCNLLVIGGGPAGLTAALTAAKRGASVQLWEAGDRLGGGLLAAGAPEFKRDIRRFAQYLQHRAEMSSVRVFLRRRATAAEICRQPFHSVFVATGGQPQKPDLPGADREQVLTATDYLRGREIDGHHLAVIGGGLVGCETALYAAARGREVTLIERRPSLLELADLPKNNLQALQSLVAENDIRLLTAAEACAIEAGGLRYRQQGREYRLACDAVAVACGYTRDRRLADALTAAGARVTIIGDNAFPRRILDAVREGFLAALSLR